MSDEENKPNKRPIPEDEGDESDEAIGPSITDAAPAKKQKGKNFPAFFIAIKMINSQQFWNMNPCTCPISRMPIAMRKVTCIVTSSRIS